jgi:hypothetical protein
MVVSGGKVAPTDSLLVMLLVGGRLISRICFGLVGKSSRGKCFPIAASMPTSKQQLERWKSRR